MKYYIFFILNLFITSKLHTQNKPEINFLAMELHSDYYKENSYQKDAFINYVNSDSLFSKFPNIVRSFEFTPDSDLISFCKKCELNIKNSTRDFNDNKIGSIVNLCYVKYIQTSPELRFAFELQDNNAIYHIKEVSIYIYNTRIAHGTDKNYFAHKKDEREKLFINMNKIKQYQKIKLNQAHAIKNGGLALNLRFFSSEHWNGSFEKTKVLMHIDFIFTNGQIINSKPFMVEM